MEYSSFCEIYEALNKTTKRLKVHIISDFKELMLVEMEQTVLLLEGEYSIYDQREIGVASINAGMNLQQNKC